MNPLLWLIILVPVVVVVGIGVHHFISEAIESHAPHGEG